MNSQQSPERRPGRWDNYIRAAQLPSTKGLLSRRPDHNKEACHLSHRCPQTKGPRGRDIRTVRCSRASSLVPHTDVGMPLPRRRSSFLGQPAPGAPSERPGAMAGVGRLSTSSTTAPRGVFVGMAPTTGTSGGLGARVSRRALGISSVFLQGLRSSTIPVVPQAGERSRQPTFESLNGCLLEYRDKVRALEQLNQQLEEQIRHCLDRKASSAGTWGALRREWEDIYRQVRALSSGELGASEYWWRKASGEHVSEAILDNARLMLQTENVQASAEDFKDRYENEQPFRKAVEEEINSLYKVIDDASLTKTDLEAQIESMKGELRDLVRNHEQDVRVLYNQLAGTEVDEPDAPIETSLDQILGYIRSHWEKAIEKNRAETDAYLEYKAESVETKLSREEEELESLKMECNDAGCKIQSLQAETESMRALKRGLENSLNDAKHWHDIELQNLGSVIAKLEAELSDVRNDIEQQRRDYETLLNNKMRLELEIGTYHGILDGEESRYHPAMYVCHPTEKTFKTISCATTSSAIFSH
ncbi:phakinin-like [Scleropages formosus]|uniref:Phakinin-like n=1 Tax=Scleropages formosus TaxID=113540 RepID=A0A0N8JYS5_SCLFO|nr:phakinin-like [Scleropages formosus]